MASYTTEKTEAFRIRWIGKRFKIAEVVTILKGNGSTNDPQELKNSYDRANQILTDAGFPSLRRRIPPLGIAANLPSLDLRGIELVGLNCENIMLIGVNLEGAELQATNFKSANFWQAHLEDAELFNAQLQGASLQLASLAGVNLRGAGLEGTNLGLTNLRGADLIGANISGTIFNNASFGKRKIDEFEQTTIFQDNAFLPRWRDQFFENYSFKLNLKAILNRKFGKLLSFQIKWRKKPQWQNFRKHLFHRWF